jgi:hypothetical protein
MVGEEIAESITNALGNAIETMILAVPRVIGAIIILIIGYIIGKLLGGLIQKILEKAKVNERVIKNTLIGKLLNTINMTFARLIGVLVSIFFYVVFILAAIEILDIELLSSFVNQVLLYLPNLIAGILILVIGLIAVEWITKFIKNTTKEYKVMSADLITMFLRAVLVLVVIVITLDQWMIDTSIIYTFIQPLAWGVAAAIAVSFGWGFKDVVANWSKKKADEWNKAKK